MPFGSLPHRSPLKNLVLRITGFPNLIRRLQAPVIMKMMDACPGETILDAGCGYGHFAYELGRRAGFSVGCDWQLSPRLGDVAARSDRLAFAACNVLRMPFADRSFDKVLLSSVIQTVTDESTLLRECRRVLRGRGRLVLSVSADYVHYDWLNRNREAVKNRFRIIGRGFFNYPELKRLLAEHGFRIIDFAYSPKWWGSLIYETMLVLAFRFHLPFSWYLAFPFAYAASWPDRFVGGSRGGCEFVVTAVKGTDA